MAALPNEAPMLRRSRASATCPLGQSGRAPGLDYVVGKPFEFPAVEKFQAPAEPFGLPDIGSPRNPPSGPFFHAFDRPRRDHGRDLDLPPLDGPGHVLARARAR